MSDEQPLAARVRTARVRLNAAQAEIDSAVSDMADLVAGRLRGNVGYSTLKKLKDELRNFHARTGKWK